MSRNADRDGLFAAFRHKAVEPDTLFLLNAQDALDFLDAAKSLGFKLAGVEGFLITDAGAYQPSQDFSNDRADSNASPAEFEAETKDLILRGVSIGMRFQVVFEPDH